MTTLAAEAQRQVAFLRLLAAPAGTTPPPWIAESGLRAAAGLRAYRGNAGAVADKALAAVFPTLRELLGRDAFGRLATEFRQASPPVHGDLGAWGASLPDFVESCPALRPWPWLGDCARLDLALHHNERAADAVLDHASLRLLADCDPSCLRLVPMPGTAALRSDWPIETIYRAHRRPTEAAGDAFASARQAVECGRGESVMIVRQGWRAVTVPLDPSTCAWTTALLAGTTLAEALDQAGAGFDFGAWLARAVGGSWLSHVEAVAAATHEGDVE